MEEKKCSFFSTRNQALYTTLFVRFACIFSKNQELCSIGLSFQTTKENMFIGMDDIKKYIKIQHPLSSLHSLLSPHKEKILTV